MANDLVWTKKRLGAFIEQACLSEEEKEVLLDWFNKHSPTWTASHRSMSKSKVEKIRTRLRKQYDIVQAENPDILPPRTRS